MEQKRYRRDTAFLYPSLEEECSPSERELTLELITQITAIVNSANSVLTELVDGGNFSFVNCMPTVHMECISDISTRFVDYENVRICVTGFDEHDYTTRYQDLIKAYQSGNTGISHLISLRIISRQQKAIFAEDNQFDTSITTSLDYLENILVSIMFDISVYHYFGLSSDLPDRKDFNTIKYDYLLHKYTEKEQLDNYGKVFPETPLYLPISLPDVRKLDRRIKHDSRQEVVNEILVSFASFLSESLMAIKVEKDSEGDIVGPSPSIPDDIFAEVEKTIHENKGLKKFVIVFLKDSTENSIKKVIQYTPEGKVPCWVEKKYEGETLYKIVFVKQRDD